jgi:hypothetical protein
MTHTFTMTDNILKRLTTVNRMLPTCEVCKERIKNGQRVLSKCNSKAPGHLRGSLVRYYHESCYQDLYFDPSVEVEI